MSTRAASAAATAALVALVGLLAGCGDDDAPGPDPDPAAGELTPTGTTLAVGETATLPLADDAGVVDVTVTGIEAGEPDQVQGLEGTPYFVRMQVTSVSGRAREFFPESYVVGWTGDTQVPPVASPLTVGPCSRTTFRTDVAPGETLETCVTFVVRSGELDRAGFDNDEEYQADQGTAVEWS